MRTVIDFWTTHHGVRMKRLSGSFKVDCRLPAELKKAVIFRVVISGSAGRGNRSACPAKVLEL